MSIDLNMLSKTFFYFDKPVNYKLNEKNINIYPINVEDSEIFLSSIDLFAIDKNSAPIVEIIQMSYLRFIIDVLLIQNKENLQCFINLLSLCLKMKNPSITTNTNGKLMLIEGNDDYLINEQQFEDIRRIILYQNLIHYDDSYVNPDLRKAMNEINELKNKDFEDLTIERRIAIITAHTGISKKEQLTMTYRSHSLLFEEVCSEVDFTTIRPIALFSGEGEKLNHWIFRKKKNNMENYITNLDSYAKSMGSDKNAIKSTNENISEQYLSQFDNFNK